MRCKERTAVVSGAVFDTTLDLTASLLKVAGGLTCVAGGMMVATANMSSKTYRSAYYGATDAQGQVLFDVRLADTNLGLNFTFPFRIKGQQDNESIYDLDEHVDSTVYRLMGVAFIASGMTLMALSFTLEKQQQHRNDDLYHKTHYGLSISKPSLKEYAYTNAQSLCFSLTLAMFGNAVLNCIIYYSELTGSDFNLTLPFKSVHQVSSTHYSGPVIISSTPIGFVLDTTNVSLPITDLYLSVSPVIEAIANFTLGGGLFFQSEKPSDVPPEAAVTLALATGCVSYALGTFFNKRAKHQRDERIYDERLEGNQPIRSWV